MKIIFSIKHSFGNKYTVGFSLPTTDGAAIPLNVSCRTKTQDITDLVRRARANIATAVLVARKELTNTYKGVQYTYEWDTNTEFLPDVFKKQTKNYGSVEPKKAEEQPKDTKKVFEVVSVNGVWTIKRHEQELMTFEEAVKELYERI